MDLINKFIDILFHLDKYLGALITDYGTLVYLIIFLVIFFETALVVTPFLPGDSVIFATALFAAKGLLNIWVIVLLLIVAAILGDTVNYSIGKFIGTKILESDSKIIKKEYVEKTNSYFDKYGGKTIVIARFVPIVRTFAPFIAGVGEMHYKEFIKFNALGGFLWVGLISAIGYFFGNIPFIQNNFSLVTILIIIVSVLPVLISLLKSKVAQNA
ncbi:DedA family protein [Clostridium chrysemydis]|uniref:DedA family protein n=1 Tax=Clostridium chrysemydis TaxID=2665504 RepID=UPI0018840E11|nr:DedA family protein [Clostridium chrysemydis]